MKYTYAFSGTVTVEAKSEKEAYEKADDILALTAYQYDNTVDCGIYEIKLTDKE